MTNSIHWVASWLGRLMVGSLLVGGLLVVTVIALAPALALVLW